MSVSCCGVVYLCLLLARRVQASEEGLPPVIMFAFDDYFPAVAATDLLVRGAPINNCLLWFLLGVWISRLLLNSPLLVNRSLSYTAGTL